MLMLPNDEAELEEIPTHRHHLLTKEKKNKNNKEMIDSTSCLVLSCLVLSSFLFCVIMNTTKITVNDSRIDVMTMRMIQVR